MHEWALAEGVIAAALGTAEKEGIRRIKKIVVTLGELQQIQIGVFEYALKEVGSRLDPRLEMAEIVLQKEPPVFRCRACQRVFNFQEAKGSLTEEEAEAIHFLPELAHTFFVCPECGRSDFEITQGRGVWIDSMEGE